MTNKRRFANEPLMYIHQPNPNKPSAPMQHLYTSPKKSKVQNSSQETEKKTIQAPVRQRRPLSTFDNGTAVDPIKRYRGKIELESSSSSSSSMDSNSAEESVDLEEKKKFKDMTNKEKIHYFMNTPSHLPKLRCEVLTVGKKYRGVILDFTDNVVRMRVGRRSVQINFDDINDILLLGF